MKINCTTCGREVIAEENQKQCECGTFYGLTPYFSKLRVNMYHGEESENLK